MIPFSEALRSAPILALAGMVAFLALAAALDWWRGSSRLVLSWAFACVLFGGIAGRVGHLVANWELYADAPWDVFAVWDSGFSGQGVAGGMVLVTALAVGRRPDLLRPAIVLSLAAFLIWQGVARSSDPRAGGSIAEMTFETLDGTGFNLSESRGRPVVLNLWATWCAPCRSEMPMMADVATQMNDVTFVFANQKEQPQRIAFFLATERLSLPNVVLDPRGDLGRAHASFGLPATIFLTSDGAVAGVHIGEISEIQLRSAIARLQGTSSDLE